MIEYDLALASSGAVKTPGYETLLRFGYNKNRGVYRLVLSAEGEWQGLTIRVFWHLPDGAALSSLVENGAAEVPPLVTAQPGEGSITFEGSDGARTLTSADVKYRVAANSGTEEDDLPQPEAPAWQQLVHRVDAVSADARESAEQAKRAVGAAEKNQSAAQQAAESAADDAASAAQSLRALQEGIANGSFRGEKGDTGAVGPRGETGPVGPQGPKGEKGETGLTGPEGPRGNTGPAGPQGETGPAGPAGPRGETGATGPQGPKGEKGDPGVPGKDAVVDSTLKLAGSAADAKATGDALAGKAGTGHTHDDRYYTEAEVDTKLAGKAATSHTHDDRYYTKGETDNKLGGKADNGHTHNYLPLSGGTVSGPLNFANCTWNLVGDDAYIGDHNIGGAFCIMGANGITAFALVNKDNQDDYALIQYSGGNIDVNKTIGANVNGNCYGYADLLYNEGAGPMRVYWSGQDGQPSWVFGSNDGTHTYIWNPSNFNVNYATGAGNVGGYTFASQDWDPGAGSALTTGKLLIVYV